MPKNVKITTFPSLLDILAPYSCRGCGTIGHVLCNRCKNYIINAQTNFCPHCKSPNPTGNCKNCQDLPRTFIGGERSGLLDDLIHTLKYDSARALAHPLAEIINHALPNIKGGVVIVPLPTIDKHIRTRGLDHTYLIAKHLAHLRNYKVQRLLIRQNNTIQVGANRITRIKQASEAYQINNHININPNTTYILLDDVWTTGASLRSAYQKLHASGAKRIILAILAVSKLD